jgi:UDP-3-O-[3-hydroxymyristoyl] glucosamine N-acyltransferase
VTDAKFYQALGPVAAETLAAGSPVLGDRTQAVASVAPFGSAQADGLSYRDGRPKGPLPPLRGCVVAQEALAPSLLEAGAEAVIIAPAPRAAFARMLGMLFRQRAWMDDGPAPVIEAEAKVSPHAILSSGCMIGAGAIIAPLAVIGPGCAIGRGSIIGPHVSIQCALIGDGVTIGPGAVIGERGFGVAGDAGGLVDMPHLGRVIIQDRVSIGAGTTVDRGMLDDTVIGEDSKIDNLCQIAHNVRVGRRVVVAAFGGISGSTIVEDGARLGGRVGIADHRHIGEKAELAAGSAVMHDVPAGEMWGGYPAQPARTWMRQAAWLRKQAQRKSDGGQ